MDEVELALPEAAVVGSKLMGSEGFSGGGGYVRAAVGKVQAGLPENNSVMISTSFDACSQRANIPPEPAFRYKVPDAGRFVSNGLPSKFHRRDASEDLKLGNVNASQSLTTIPEAKQLDRRTGKVSRSTTGGSKRSRIVELELSINESGVEDIKGNPSSTRPCPLRYKVAESVVPYSSDRGQPLLLTMNKTQMPKQRNNSNAKRGDKRNSRAPKSRCDSFCLKNGLVNFSSVAGGGNFVVYGSKSGIFDVTKPVDELPLNELLDGSYNRPVLVKDKGKAVENSNDNLLLSVRKACSLLRLQGPLHIQNSSNIDNSDNQKISVGTIDTCSTSRINDDKADSCNENQPSSYKDSRGYVLPAIAVDSPLCPPKDMLERLALPPSKDLDSLLQDAVKPASSSRNSSDLRLGKTVSHRTGLPPFPWSHNSSGHSKSGSDTVKFSANRTICPGRWVKVGTALTPLKGSNGLVVDLKSLTYNQRLVPSGNLESAPLGVENSSSTCVNITSCEQGVLLSSACSTSEDPPAEYSPKLLAAAQTLCEIASHSSKQNSHEMMKWLKKPSLKTLKACKSKLSQKSEKLFVAPKASMGPDNLVRKADGMFPGKKLRLSVDEMTDAVCHVNPDRKGPIYTSATKSIRSSPSKLYRDSVPEVKNFNNHIVKKSFMVPRPSRVANKDCNSRQKLKKIMPMDWNTTASNLD